MNGEKAITPRGGDIFSVLDGDGGWFDYVDIDDIGEHLAVIVDGVGVGAVIGDELDNRCDVCGGELVEVVSVDGGAVSLGDFVIKLVGDGVEAGDIFDSRGGLDDFDSRGGFLGFAGGLVDSFDDRGEVVECASLALADDEAAILEQDLWGLIGETCDWKGILEESGEGIDRIRGNDAGFAGGEGVEVGEAGALVVVADSFLDGGIDIGDDT